MTLPGGLEQVLHCVEEDFEQRLPGYHKSRRGGLVMLTGLMLEVRSANLMELAAALPREIGSKDHRYQYIERLLGNTHIDCDEIMEAYACEIFRRLAADGQTIVLMLDQSKINDLNQVLMLSVRIRGRALPVAWRVRTTKGNIGFEVQKDLLEAVVVPDGGQVRGIGGEGDGRERGAVPAQASRELGGDVLSIRGGATVAEEKRLAAGAVGRGDPFSRLRDLGRRFSGQIALHSGALVESGSDSRDVVPFAGRLAHRHLSERGEGQENLEKPRTSATMPGYRDAPGASMRATLSGPGGRRGGQGPGVSPASRSGSTIIC